MYYRVNDKGGGEAEGRGKGEDDKVCTVKVNKASHYFLSLAQPVGANSFLRWGETSEIYL